ncbi:MAG: antibiotic biosynthesis monooxygenase [Acidobacteriia bacterium]|nr:antibiotic biosynthesis monooxygenase [Terriglobia bacterium]
MSELLTVIARIRAKAGQQGRLRQQLLSLVTPTRAEPGCVCYDLHESNTEPGLFVFYETWKTEADLDAHFQTPHMQAFHARIPDLVEGAIDLTKCSKI